MRANVSTVIRLLPFDLEVNMDLNPGSSLSACEDMVVYNDHP